MKRHELLDVIPQDQLDRISVIGSADMDKEFLGFTEAYKALAAVIPKGYTVLDLGCGYAAQCFYFRDHAGYIGVDLDETDRRFHAENTTHVMATIQDFIRNRLTDFVSDLHRVFAICNYVPDENAQRMVRGTFPNLFVFYPSGS